MKEEWLMPGAVVPVDPNTTKALVDEIKRLIGTIGGMALQARSAPVHKPYRPLQDNGSQYFGDSWDTPPAQPAPVQEPVAWGVDWGKAGDIPCVSIIKRLPSGGIEVVAVEYAPYSYTQPAARPAVPDAFGTREGEHPQYIQGWNDCRAEMLRGMNT